jgi:SMC interacting uncharacterized protein involved in chromosome segregation
MIHKSVFFCAFLSLAFFTSSCFWVTTKEEGHALRRDVQHLSDRIDQIESELEGEQANLKEMIARARADMEKLDETLTRATRVLARNSADFGAEMESLKDKMREIEGSLAEIDHEIEESGKRMEDTNK